MSAERAEKPAIRMVRVSVPRSSPAAAAAVMPARRHAPRGTSAAQAGGRQPAARSGPAVTGTTANAGVPGPATKPAAARGAGDEELAAVKSLAVSVVEALYGLRPAAQLRRWVEPEVMARIDAHVTRRMELLRGRPERVTTVRAGTVLLQRTAADVLDASVVVHSTVRIRAVALQLRRWKGRWRVSAFLTA